jgi:hypothetical protein
VTSMFPHRTLPCGTRVRVHNKQKWTLGRGRCGQGTGVECTAARHLCATRWVIVRGSTLFGACGACERCDQGCNSPDDDTRHIAASRIVWGGDRLERSIVTVNASQSRAFLHPRRGTFQCAVEIFASVDGAIRADSAVPRLAPGRTMMMRLPVDGRGRTAEGGDDRLRCYFTVASVQTYARN